MGSICRRQISVLDTVQGKGQQYMDFKKENASMTLNSLVFGLS